MAEMDILLGLLLANAMFVLYSVLAFRPWLVEPCSRSASAPLSLWLNTKQFLMHRQLTPHDGEAYCSKIVAESAWDRLHTHRSWYKSRMIVKSRSMSVHIRYACLSLVSTHRKRRSGIQASNHEDARLDTFAEDEHELKEKLVVWWHDRRTANKV